MRCTCRRRPGERPAANRDAAWRCRFLPWPCRSSGNTCSACRASRAGNGTSSPRSPASAMPQPTVPLAAFAVATGRRWRSSAGPRFGHTAPQATSHVLANVDRLPALPPVPVSPPPRRLAHGTSPRPVVGARATDKGLAVAVHRWRGGVAMRRAISLYI
jgi:hypothetical protein